MSDLRAVRLIAERELRERARARGFVVATCVLLLAAAAAGAVPAFLDSEPEAVEVGVVGPPSPAVASALRLALASSGDELRVVGVGSVAEGEGALRDGDVDLVVEGMAGVSVRGERTGERARTSPDGWPPPSRSTSGWSRQACPRAHRRAAGRSPSLRPRGGASSGGPRSTRCRRPRRPGPVPGPPHLRRLGGDGRARGEVQPGGRGGAFSGAAHRAPGRQGDRHRPPGRRAAGAGRRRRSRRAVVAGSDAPSSAPNAVGLVLLWFVLGFAFNSCAFAAAGSAASRQEDAQAAMGPLYVMLVVGYLLSTGVQANPDGAMARIGSFVPPPLTAPARVLLGHPPVWEVLASVALMIVATYGLVRLAGRVYGGAVLRFGPRLGLRELLSRSA